MLIEEATTVQHILIAVPTILIPIGAGYIVYRIHKMRKARDERRAGKWESK